MKQKNKSSYYFDSNTYIKRKKIKYTRNQKIVIFIIALIIVELFWSCKINLLINIYTL